MKDPKEIKKKLSEVSGSLCLAKWQQVTVHLQNGLTHSCHHPIPHKIPLEEIKQSPDAIHNTFTKKIQRKLMLEGKRPNECDYCWRIEDSSPENVSDRFLKSSEEWAYPHFDKVISTPWHESVDPSYLEVNFGNECHFKCAYCSPSVSSAILNEFQKYGSYRMEPYFDLNYLKSIQEFPYHKDEHNPYIEAFWKWWPELSKKLKVFRITGGEPLLNQNTFAFLESLKTNPLPELEFAVNTNMSVPQTQLSKFTELAKHIIDKGLTKKFQIYTSVDSFGDQAEYIRFGLDYVVFLENVRNLLREIPSLSITLISTFNALSIPGFKNLLKDIKELKSEFLSKDGSSRVRLNTPYLRYPVFMSASVIPGEYYYYVEEALDFMLRNAFIENQQIFSNEEINEVRRIVEWLKSCEQGTPSQIELQSRFIDFFTEYDLRKGTNFCGTFPEFRTFWESRSASTLKSD